MKLKYKLAREWCINKELNLRSISRIYYSTEAYLAGFDKAMELVREYMYENQIEGADGLLDLGEEEVSE